jgi:hypothetical protein
MVSGDQGGSFCADYGLLGWFTLRGFRWFTLGGFCKRLFGGWFISTGKRAVLRVVRFNRKIGCLVGGSFQPESGLF